MSIPKTTDKQVDKTRLSTVSNEVIFSYVLWSIQRPCRKYNLPLGRIQTNASHNYCKVIINRIIVYGFSHFPDNDKEQIAGVTSHQRMLTSPWHINQPQIFLDVRICCSPVLYFPFELLILNTVRYHHLGIRCLILLSFVPWNIKRCRQIIIKR